MSRRKRRKKSSKKSVKLNKWYIFFVIFIFSFLYFFLKFTAYDSLAFLLIGWIPTFLFGEIGSYIFFWGLLFLAILILFKDHLLKDRIFKKFLITLFFFLPIINFVFLENENLDPEKYGWWLGYAQLQIASFLLWNQTIAIKWFFIFLFLLSFVWFSWKFWKWLFTSLPSFSVEISEQSSIPNSSKPARKITKKSSSEGIDNLSSNNTKTQQVNEKLLKKMIEEKVKTKISEKKYEKIQIKFPEDKPTFDINLLEQPESTEIEIDTNYLVHKANSVQKKLEEFGIQVSIEWFNIGPTVLQIKLKPAPWVSVSKIESRKKDLAMALRVKSLRILAPIPGTEFVGIEIPNPKPRIVKLREIIQSPEFAQSVENNFTNLALGISIDGKKIIKSLESMPHLLVAGATWMGKSVGINDFVLSLIYQNTPSELKFIMIDPKQVELGIYEWIPYLLSPIIVDPDKAVKVLKWAVQHMDERYSKLKKVKARNLDEYNVKVWKNEKMYRIVIIVDELADLMMGGNKKETETAITRLAQKARAVGMHLIIATQRPSVDVITWVLKANIPARIAFGTISQVDSRTILDVKWAEDLIWKWDMLYKDTKQKYPLRIQAPFVSTLEVEKVVEYIKEKYMKGISEEDIYLPEIVNILEWKAETVWAGDISDADEELVQQAIQIIAETRKASATLLQRKLGIGFARAARIMDILEQRWIVGPQEGAKPREIYI